jgi:hypothetical protein
VHRQASPVPELTEPVNQYSLVPLNKSAPAVPICVACDITFKNKSSLSRHYQQHCERQVEWLCQLCHPMKSFYRREKLCQHHIDHHAVGCVPNCKYKRGGLCDWHLAGSIQKLPEKKAWGCPCCLRCFDSWDAWIKHGANHPVQNDKVVGWSLITMVQSLLFQPFIADAISTSPLRSCDLTKVKADVCQNLREALERHELPDAVQAHYDYRHLQRPEALALYAFRLVAYGEPFLDDISVVTHSADTAAQAVPRFHSRLEVQVSAPTSQSVPDLPSSGYWNPKDPFTYSPKACPTAEPETVPHRLTDDLFDAASRGSLGTKSSRVNAQHQPRAVPAQFHVAALQDLSASSSSGQALLNQPFSNAGCTFLESSSVEKERGRALSVKKSLQNLVHRPSSSKSSTSRSDAIRPLPAVPDGRAAERSRTCAMLDFNRESTRVEPMETVPSSPRQARLSGRMSGVQWDAWVIWPQNEQHDL